MLAKLRCASRPLSRRHRKQESERPPKIAMLVFRGGSVLREVGEAGCVPTAPIVIQLTSGFSVLTHKKKIPPAGYERLHHIVQ
jgi:hypothetical protein